MALYAIGDIQGCHREFRDLLQLIGFSPARDTLWLVGDLVNRGPDSLAVLRDVIALGDAARVVLGNHDFHLLTVAAGLRRQHRGDTLDAVLAAPDRDVLVRWLTTRPLLVAEDELVMVHAGVLPPWTVATAAALAREVEAVLASPDSPRFLSVLYGNEPHAWRDDLAGDARWRFIVNTFTRLRFCTAAGELELLEKRGHAHAPAGFRPWFDHPSRRSARATVVCGHWSTLDLMLAPNVLMLDSGCVWGGTLTAVRLDDRKVFQVPSYQPLALLPSG
ncbi:MAG: symmetrical bis(5'-nucleosyl)-tetraphosphatase [Proteobacteria bacterium]|nr:symmetrical bis(5'-nucleosyl)-tetraphosphatase [Pseudomonadota bacterium]